ncbi:MAG: regulatory protein RecX [Sandaracinaceae bacterium]|nr:hypothetical protein [Myxococcales bacterium]
MPRKKPKKVTLPYLERVALWYLERYGGTSERVRRALDKRVRASVEEHGTDREEGRAMIEEVITKLRRLGYLDDAKFVLSRVRTLRDRGKSARAIRWTLMRQGADGALVDEALEGEGTDDLSAAEAFARKRRIGPHRDPEKRAEMREKDLAKLARAGFSYDIARRVLGD